MVWLHWSMVPVMFCDSILMNHGMLYWCGTMVSCNTGSCVQSHNHLPVIVIFFFHNFSKLHNVQNQVREWLNEKVQKSDFINSLLFVSVCFGVTRVKPI